MFNHLKQREHHALKVFRNRVSSTPDDEIWAKLDLLKRQDRVERHVQHCPDFTVPLFAPKGVVDERYFDSAKALLRNTDFLELVKKFGGFWWQGILRLKPAAGGKWDAEGGLRALGVEPWQGFSVESWLDFQSTVESLFESCPHFSEKICIICHTRFRPSYLTILDFRVGAGVCTKCCLVAAGETDARSWLASSKTERLSEISLGVELAFEANTGKLAVHNNPLTDSADALRQAQLIDVDHENFLSGFLSVALRPKYRQVVKDFESWPVWTATLSTPHKRSFPETQRLLVANDGHRCFSRGELEVCDFLSSHGILHDREVLYSDLPNVNGYVWGIADFVAGSLVIEFAGLIDDADYSHRLETKVEAAREAGIEVVVIRPPDLKNLRGVLGEKLLTEK